MYIPREVNEILTFRHLVLEIEEWDTLTILRSLHIAIGYKIEWRTKWRTVSCFPRDHILSASAATWSTSSRGKACHTEITELLPKANPEFWLTRSSVSNIRFVILIWSDKWPAFLRCIGGSVRGCEFLWVGSLFCMRRYVRGCDTAFVCRSWIPIGVWD